MSLNLPTPERVPAGCCPDHNIMCWYDACCGQCSELERCRAHMGDLRCVLPVSQHADPQSLDPHGHEWRDLRPAPLLWEGDPA